MEHAEVELRSLADTEDLGRRLGRLLFSDAVIGLIGQLGAGKTHLTRAIAEGLEVANPMAVTSPTFTLVHEYPARLPIFHFDTYRLGRVDEFLDLGVDEYFTSGGVCLIEWADRVLTALPAEHLRVRLSVVSTDARMAIIESFGPRHQRLLEDLMSDWNTRLAVRDEMG